MKIKIKMNLETNVNRPNIPGYNPYQTPSESFKGGVIIYVKHGLEVKRRTDLESKMYESGKLESVFLVILKGKKKMRSLAVYIGTPQCT